MQYRIPVGCGPSSKTCPRWASHRLHFTSVRRMPWLVSVSASTASSLAGAQKLGHPEPEWNLVSERKRGWPQQTQPIGAGRIGVLIFAGERRLSAFLPRHKVLILRELFLPGRVILTHLSFHSAFLSCVLSFPTLSDSSPLLHVSNAS